MNIFEAMIQKWRGQPTIQRVEGENIGGSNGRKVFFERSYDSIEVVRRGVDMIVDSASDVDVNITKTLVTKPVHIGKPRYKQKTLLTLLNFTPNKSEDVNEFRRQLVMDFILTGNAYQFFDATTNSLYHLPANLMTIVTDDKDKVSHYTMQEEKTRFEPHEIIHTKDNSSNTIYKGQSRLFCTRDTINILKSMLAYQDNFFDNGAVPGLIIQTPNILGHKIKEKLLQQWKARYNPRTGGKSPLILDGDLKVNPLSATKFSELEFETSVTNKEIRVLKALGVPPILLDSGNNANLRPNIQLFYEMTVLPLVSKFISSYERFFGWDMEPDLVKVRALRPELREAGQYFTGLVNGGIMTINEARNELRLDPSTEAHASKLRIPQNIAGSATDPGEGGRPPSDEEDDDEEEETTND